MFPGMILFWFGDLLAIPFGWQLCDGTNGTPDLRDRFIAGAGSTYAPGAAGGATTHVHAIGVTSHAHVIPETVEPIAAGTDFNEQTSSTLVFPKATTPATSLPPYHALYPIMKL